MPKKPIINDANLRTRARAFERSAQYVGGPKGLKRAFVPGHKPHPVSISFDDYTAIRQDSPNVNFHPDGGGDRDPPAIAATGGITFDDSRQPTSGDTVTINDNSGNTVIFGFGSGGDVTVTIGATVEITLANLVTAINGSSLAATAADTTTGDPEITVTLDQAGQNGNGATMDISGSTPPSVTANFAGGSDQGNPKELKDHWDGSTVAQWQMFFRAEHPFNSIRQLVFPNNVGSGIIRPIWTATWANIVSAGQKEATCAIIVTLIRVPMYVGGDGPGGTEEDAALDKLTWNNSFLKTLHMSGPNSTLYDTADNVELLSRGNEDNIFGGGSCSADFKDGGGADFRNYASTLGVNFENVPFSTRKDQGDNGPFYGIHVCFDNLYKGGFWMDPSSTILPQDVSVSTCTYRFHNLDAPPDGRARPYILLDDLDLMNE